jgi:hypothetical protein
VVGRGANNSSPWGEGGGNYEMLHRGSELDASGSGEGPVAGSCERGNESSVSTKGGGFLD